MIRWLASMLFACAALVPLSASAGGGWDRLAIKPEEAKILREWAARSIPVRKVATAAPAGDGAAGPGRGERLALDRYQAAQHVPEEVLQKLPDQPRATRLIVLDGQVVRVFRPTRTVVDVLANQ